MSCVLSFLLKEVERKMAVLLKLDLCISLFRSCHSYVLRMNHLKLVKIYFIIHLCEFYPSAIPDNGFRTLDFQT